MKAECDRKTAKKKWACMDRFDEKFQTYVYCFFFFISDSPKHGEENINCGAANNR